MDASTRLAAASSESLSPLRQRPAYGPPISTVAAYLLRNVQITLIYTIVAKALLPVYSRLHQSVITAGLTRAAVDALAARRLSWVVADDMFFTVGLSLALCASWVLANGFFGLCDGCQWLQQYKLPRRPAQEPSSELIWTTLRKEFFAHCITGPLLMLFAAGPGLRAVGAPVAATDVPGWPTVWAQFMVQLHVNETMFYWGHRLLHTRPLYARIHKLHHAYVGTRSFAGEYAHVVEDVLTAYIPFLTGLFLTRSHFHLVFVWFHMRLLTVAENHSGYCFRGTWPDSLGLANARSSAHHDFHHTHNNGNFGSPLLDWIFGTCDAYLAIGGEAGYVAMAQRQRAGNEASRRKAA